MITQPGSALSIAPSQTNISCGGTSTGSATATAGGGTTPYTYSWSPLGGTGATATNLPAGTYTCTLTDVNNCSVTQTYSITQPPVLVATLSSQSNIMCYGACTGSGSITASGGTPGYYYSWTPTGGASNSATGLCAGTYTCTLTDMNSCAATKIFNITQPAAQLLTALSPMDVTCYGACNGSVSSNTTGGTAPYTYSWGPAGGTVANPTNLCPNTYSVYVTDANGCNAMGSTGIAQPAAALTIVPTQANISCFGGNNGSATASANGGTAPYTYSWVPAPGSGQGTSVANNLTAGTYTCTVTDNKNCTAVQTFVITQGTAIVIAPTQSNISCFGGTTGTATAVVSGGSPSYTFNWVPAPGTGQGTLNAGGLASGTYTFTAKDMLNCIATQTYVITSPAQLIANITGTNASCPGSNNGTGAATPTGGTVPYTYSWTPTAGATSTLTGLAPNSYSCTVTDSHGCFVIGTMTVTQPAALILTPSQTNISCGGSSNGSATVTANGGTPGYTYSWSPAPGAGQGTLTASSLSAGTYTCNVTDAHACLAGQTFSITSPAAIAIAPSQVNNVCSGNATGTASGVASGGTPSYTYTWSPAPGGGQNTANATGLLNGNYTLTVKDMNNCSASQVYSITSPAPLTAAPTSTNITCNGTCNGSIIANVAGGTVPYTYSWSNGATTATVSALCAGTYSCSVLDNHGCSVIPTASISQPPALVITPSLTGATCSASNGTATAAASGGTAPYTYSWSPTSATTSTITSLAAATYSCTLKDANNCSVVHAFVITTTTVPTVSIAPVNVSCNGACNGSAAATPSGGTPPYTYSWAPSGGATSSAVGLCANIYTCHVTDMNGCASLLTTTISQPAALTVTASSTPATCGSSNGIATATPAGGTVPYTYSWSVSGATTASSSGLSAGSYSCTVTDAKGCTAIGNTGVSNSSAPALSESAHVNVSCNGMCTGSSTVTPVGGTLPYTYSWSPLGGTASIASGLCANTYTCTVTDANGCSSLQIAVITQPTALSASLVPSETTCFGSCNGSVSSTVSGATAPYTYSWSPSGATIANPTGLCANNYTCTVTDHNGCSTMPTATVNQPAVLVASIVSQTNLVCNSNPSGIAQVGAAGGTFPYTYSWTGGLIGGGQGTTTATTLLAGNYTCNVNDMNNCSAAQTFTLTQPTPIAISLTLVPASCNSLCNGSATAAVSGGVGPYAYAWTPSGGALASATGLCAGIYTCHISDNSGCTALKTDTISQPLALSNTLTPHNSTCGAVCTGSINTAPSGGVGGYLFAWSPSGQTTAVGTALCAGTYTCTLTDANGCSLMSQSNITAPQSPLITGLVTGSISGVINDGWAYLVQYDTIPKHQHLVDSVALNTLGRYTFTGTPGGKFLIYVVANPATFPKAAKTYSPSADQWKNAGILSAPCSTSDTANITVIELAPTVGSGSFSGTVIQGTGYVPRLVVGSPAILGEPIPGLDVNLEQHPNGIVATTTTDIGGNYHFTNIPPGTFSVYVDVPGLGMVSQYTKTVTSNQSFSNLNYVADSTHIYPDTVLVITGVNAPAASTGNRVILAPNPFKDQLSVSYTLSQESDVVIEIFNILGEKVAGLSRTHQDAGAYTFRLDAVENNLSQGVYLFRMTKEGQTFTRRIVSIR
jgi:hypothetical protein